MRTNKKYYRNILFFVSFIAISFSSHGQGTIKTPKNQTINLINDWDNSSPDLIATWEADAAGWIVTYESDADKKAPATSNYNCHAYAWHISDGGDDEDSWMNYQHYGNPNVSKYWTNDTYSNVGAIGDHTKIFYGTVADHSAISQSSSNLVISKWGWWGLYEHALTDCPFNDGASFTYYSVPIDGDNIVCTSKTYSTVNIIGATYNWSGDKLSINGTTYSESASKILNGSGWVQCQISSTYSGTNVYTVKKNVWVGPPSINDFNILDLETDDNLLDPSEGNSLLAQDFVYPSQTISGWEWDFGDWWRYTLYSNGEIATIFHDYGFDYQDIGIRALNGCGASDWYYEAFYNWDYYSYYFNIFPNPANEFVELSVVQGSETKDKTAKIRIEKAKGQDGLGEYAVEIWSEKGGRLKTLTTKESHLQLSTRDLPQGNYFVHLIVNGKTYKQQLLIEK